MRVKITLSYDGSVFRGFQMQKDGIKTVANTLDEAFSKLNINSPVIASGRTDAGVHATNQVISLDLPSYWHDLKKLKIMLNRYLSPSILISDIQFVQSDFHARYSAKRRVYRYIVSTKKENVFMNRYVKFVNSIDADLMSRAVRVFEGEHDFEYFKKSDPPKSNFVRVIYKSRFYRYRDLNVFYFESNGFLRSQIRMMMSFLLKINDGKLSIENLQDQLDKKRLFSNTLESASGLYLCRIKY